MSSVPQSNQAARKGAKAAEGRHAERRLLESALALFSESGYEATSIREIIERAGVTRPVLYYYFKNKEELFWRLVESSLNEINAHIDEIAARTPKCEDRLQAVMRMAFQHAEDSPEMIRLILRVFSEPRRGGHADMHALIESRINRLVAIMDDGLKAGELARGDAETLALAFAGVMDFHIMAKAHYPEARLAPELAEGLVRLFLEGAGAQETVPPPIRSPFAERADLATAEKAPAE